MAGRSMQDVWQSKKPAGLCRSAGLLLECIRLRDLFASVDKNC